MTNAQTINKFTKRADAIVTRVQKRIDTKGAYENAGQTEIRLFMDSLPLDLHYQDTCKLSDYINDRIDNLRY